jgi:hypothetical protein
VPNPRSGSVRLDLLFIFFFFYLLFSFIYFQDQLEFEFNFKPCANFILKLYCDFKITNFGNLIILFIFLYHFSSYYFQNPNFNLGFNPTFRIIILLSLSLLFYLMHKHINSNKMHFILF